MTEGASSRSFALVLAENGEAGELGCDRLNRTGYDILGFSDCEDAIALLDEDTPSLAIVDASSDHCSGEVRSTLNERGVRVVDQFLGQA